MSDERILEAAEALADEDVRQRVAGGDLSDVEGFGLTAETTERLQTFAAEIPDIEDRFSKALEALEDDDVRQRVADGDYADVEGFGLTPDETDLLKTMAAEWSEVEGFSAAMGPKGSSLVFQRSVYAFQDHDPIAIVARVRRNLYIAKYGPSIDRTASIQPLGSLQGGATI